MGSTVEEKIGKILDIFEGRNDMTESCGRVRGEEDADTVTTRFLTFATLRW